MFLSWTIFVLFVFVLVVVLVHWVGLFVFLYCIHRKEWQEPKTAYRPKVTVILALRGSDPFLHRCLSGLLSQNYGNYAVRIVVDHPDDPALKIVREVLDTHVGVTNSGIGTNDVDLLMTSRHRETCALKCNSLLEVVERLDADTEVVVTLDADTNPYSTWLAELVEPLCDDRFIASTGMRWYFPPKSNFGTLVRYLWNAAAFVQMYFYKIPWAGSMAIRRELFDQHGLGQCWEYSLSDDQVLPCAVRRSGKRIAYVTSVLMANQETCRLIPFFYWVRRQMLVNKLYHPSWPAVLGQCLTISIPQMVLIGLMIGTMWTSKWLEFYQVAGTFLLYWFAVLATLFPMECAVRRMMKCTNTIMPKRPTLSMIVATILAVLLTQAIYTLAVVSLFWQKEVDWRGVRYRLLPKGRVQLLEYKPFLESKTKTETTDSL